MCLCLDCSLPGVLRHGASDFALAVYTISGANYHRGGRTIAVALAVALVFAFAMGEHTGEAQALDLCTDEPSTQDDPSYLLFAVNGKDPNCWLDLRCPYVFHPYLLESCPCVPGEDVHDNNGTHKIISVDYVSFCQSLWLDPYFPILDDYGSAVEIQFPWTQNQYSMSSEDKTPDELDFVEPDARDFEDNPDPFAYFAACNAQVMLPMHKLKGPTRIADIQFYGTELKSGGKRGYLDRQHPEYTKWRDNPDNDAQYQGEDMFTAEELQDCEEMRRKMDRMDAAADRPREPKVNTKDVKSSSNTLCADEKQPPKGELDGDETDYENENLSDTYSIHSGSDDDQEACPEDVHYSEHNVRGEVSLDDCTHEGPHVLRSCHDKLTHRCVVDLGPDEEISSEDDTEDDTDDDEGASSREPYTTRTENEAYYYMRLNLEPARFAGDTTDPVENRRRAKKRKAFRQNTKRRYELRFNNQTEQMDLYYRSYNTKAQLAKKSVPAFIRVKMFPWRLVPRQSEVMDIVAKDHRHGGHNGAEARLRNKYRIHNLRKMVHAVSGDRCPTCAGHKPIKKFPSHAIITSRKCELVMFDFTKFYVPDKNGNKYMLTVVDHFSKFSWTKEFKTKKGNAVAKYLARKFSAEMGVPERWHADNGGEFVNGWIDAARVLLANNNHTEGKLLPYTHGMPRNPRCQGLVERFNRTIKQRMLKQMEAEGYERARPDGTGDVDWDWVPIMERCNIELNRIEVKLYGFSPHVILFGSCPEAPDHVPLLPEWLARMHQHCHTKQIAQARARGTYDELGLEPIPIGTHVMVCQLSDRRSHNDPAGNGNVPWRSEAVVVDTSNTNRNWYVIRWTKLPMFKEALGTNSSKVFPYFLLKPVAHKKLDDEDTEDVRPSAPLAAAKNPRNRPVMDLNDIPK